MSASHRPFTVAEFFCGGGGARAGLGSSWQCVFANDNDAKKAASYAANFGADALKVCDVASLSTADLPGIADLAWCSFPCKDLSLAGGRLGLDGMRSGAFWPWWRLMQALRAEGRAPKMIVIENVTGLLTSHGGTDFTAICDALTDAGYQYGALIIDAVLFVPQSRERVFIIAVDADISIPAHLLIDKPTLPRLMSPFLPPPLVLACDPLPGGWQRPSRDPLWWRLPVPPPRLMTLADIIEDAPTGVRWDTPTKTGRLMAMMTPGNLGKVEAAKRAARRMVGALYRRTRPPKDGGKVSRWEVRFDDVAGCLRMPTGGSSRQTVVIVEGDTVRSRLLSPREAARLMGLDDYALPENYNDAYGLMGDGVVVPVVRFISENLLEPLLATSAAGPLVTTAPLAPPINLEPAPISEPVNIPAAPPATERERRKARADEKKEKRARREAELGAYQKALPDKRYGVIYADPGWRFEVYSRETGMDRAADNHYATNTTDIIKALDVASIAAKDCVLFLCATAPMLPQALEVMKAWGFTYKSNAELHKDRVGTGYWFRNRHEHLLVGVRGKIPCPAAGEQWESVIEMTVGRHAQKPDAIYEMIESYFPTLPKIELYARRDDARPGWDAWGLEAPTDTDEIVIDDGVDIFDDPNVIDAIEAFEAFEDADVIFEGEIEDTVEIDADA